MSQHAREAYRDRAVELQHLRLTDAMQAVAQLVRDAGCEPVIVGNLAAGKKFERGSSDFRANTTATKLRQLLGIAEGK